MESSHSTNVEKVSIDFFKMSFTLRKKKMITERFFGKPNWENFFFFKTLYDCCSVYVD